ncbi:uncharacterized protein LOC119160865 isoform X1 [Rhipicephalus microplus]|uniref:uncharacterized protein LOC119160865 isoform X1 n=1 Tax=Rhipicephalus microplus TaxID=6941 RepID=UPI003F6A677D
MSLSLGPRFGPSLDSRPLSGYPRLQVATTYAAHREVLIGCTAGEGRFLVSLLEQTVLQGDTGNTTALSLRLKETVRQFFESLNFSRHQQRVLEKVQASIDRSEMPSQSAWRDFVGSVFVGCPVQYFIESLAQSTTTSVYVFEFAHRKLGRHVQVQGYRQAFGTSAGGYPAAPRVVTCYKRSSTRKK